MDHISVFKTSQNTSNYCTQALSSEKGAQIIATSLPNENKENGLASLAEDFMALFISPSPCKFIGRRKSFLKTSDDRKDMGWPDLGSVKKKLQFENQAIQQEALAATANNAKKKSEPLMKMTQNQGKANILKMR